MGKESTDMAITVTYPTIRQGASGEIVIQLQDLLAKDGSGIRINGIFDLATRNAVRAFQKRNELLVDGIVGPITWMKLLEQAGNIKVNDSNESLVGFLQIEDVPEDEARKLMQKYPKARWAITGIKKI